MTREVEMPPGVLATVTRVVVTPDYREAHVKVSVLPFERAPQILTFLTRVLPGLQHQLNQSITMFHVPKVVLSLDETPERAGRIEHLLDTLK
jgi:ribosome-binding factor A